MAAGKIIVACLLALSVLPAQEFRATLTGRVVDPSGAPVAGVAIQVKNAETNEVAAAATDSQGNYSAPFLRPGTYSVSAEAPGFKRATREGLVLNECLWYSHAGMRIPLRYNGYSFGGLQHAEKTLY